MTKFYELLTGFIVLAFLSCSEPANHTNYTLTQSNNHPYIVVLGIAQDAGFPQANCKKDCCKTVWNNPEMRKKVSCIALVDPSTNQAWMFDATPDFKDQWYQLSQVETNNNIILSGIFLTHAHIGHYTGLMHLGREAVGANEVPVYAMPKMKNYLATNGPWSQLVSLNNISLHRLKSDSTIQLTDALSVTPFLVPHRDEYSETVGFKITSNENNVLFIPDIDKWEKWDRDIVTMVKESTYAFLDGSFYQNGEIPGRDMSLIPHPFIEESMLLFKDLPPQDKAKVHFIHFNHTNPVLQLESETRKAVLDNGYNLSEEGSVYYFDKQ